MATHDPSLRSAILRLLERWDRLPLSDIMALLQPLERPRFRREIMEELEQEGLVRAYAAGDEWVFELTDAGRARRGE